MIPNQSIVISGMFFRSAIHVMDQNMKTAMNVSLQLLSISSNPRHISERLICLCEMETFQSFHNTGKFITTNKYKSF